MNLLQLARSGRRSEHERLSLNEYAELVASFAFGGTTYGLEQSYGTNPTGERSDSPFPSWVSAYKRNGRPGDLFGTEALAVLEQPMPTVSTRELLSRMIQDVDLAGNAFVRRTGPLATPAYERLRPDWVTIILGYNPELLGLEVAGYMYEPNGPGNGAEIFLSRDEVAHWAPIPDPMAFYRGMSWMSPVVRDVAADMGSVDHKQKFFDNAATPNMIIKFDATVALESLERFKELFNAEHQGFHNAYKTLFLGGGADASVVGANFQQMDFKSVQGHGETRIAAAAGVPPIIVGLSEGLEAATYSNYAQARRRFVDLTMRPLWGGACEALANIVNVPLGSRLWYDDRDIPALREDEADAANIQSTRAQTVVALIREGFTPDSAIRAIDNDDFRLLEHTGALSVQLQKPGEQAMPELPPPSTNGKPPAEVTA